MHCWEQGWCSCVVTCSSAGIVTGWDLRAGLSSLFPPWHLCCWLSEGSFTAGAQTLLEHSIVSALKPQVFSPALLGAYSLCK